MTEKQLLAEAMRLEKAAKRLRAHAKKIAKAKGAKKTRAPARAVKVKRQAAQRVVKTKTSTAYANGAARH